MGHGYEIANDIKQKAEGSPRGPHATRRAQQPTAAAAAAAWYWHLLPALALLALVLRVVVATRCASCTFVRACASWLWLRFRPPRSPAYCLPLPWCFAPCLASLPPCAFPSPAPLAARSCTCTSIMCQHLELRACSCNRRRRLGPPSKVDVVLRLRRPPTGVRPGHADRGADRIADRIADRMHTVMLRRIDFAIPGGPDMCPDKRQGGLVTSNDKGWAWGATDDMHSGCAPVSSVL
jgi:hypothetical protein